MDEQQVRAMAAEVLANLAPEADLGTVARSADLRDALDLDSMDFLNFIIGLSQRSGVNIPDADAPRLTTLDGIVRYFAQR